MRPLRLAARLAAADRGDVPGWVLLGLFALAAIAAGWSVLGGYVTEAVGARL